jgi:hypothetical protein
MFEGHVDHISRHIVHGWAIDTAAVERSIEVLICLDGADVARAIANLSRPDVAKIKKLPSPLHGFSVPIPEFMDPGAAHLLQIRFAETGQVIPNGERRFPALVEYDATPALARVQEQTLTPLLVTHLPRSGSTLCMASLNRHQQIVIAERYPFEVKPATYYARAARLLTQPGNHEGSASPTEFMRDPVRLGFNPFNHWTFDAVFKDPQLKDHYFERAAKTALFESLRSVAMDYYRHLAADQSKFSARFFAEKCEVQGGIRESVLDLFPSAREILLVRDPRDMLCSSVSYFKRPLDQDLLQNLRNGCEAIRQIALQPGKRTLVVKYESLIFDQPGTLKVIARFLELTEPAWSGAAIEDLGLFNRHATTDSPEASVGRWKTDLSAEQRTMCGQVFGRFLSQFGYEGDGG